MFNGKLKKDSDKKVNLPRMACAHACGKNLRRFHVTCIFCHYRRAYMTQLNPKKYHYAKDGYFVGSRSYTTIFLAVDNNRRYAIAKGILLKKLIVIAEVLAN
jgi:hypothetical protein